MRRTFKHHLRRKRFQAGAAVLLAMGGFAVVGAQGLFIGGGGQSFCQAVKDIPEFEVSSDTAIAGELEAQHTAYIAIAKAAPDPKSKRSAETLASFYADLGKKLKQDSPKGTKAAATFVLNQVSNTRGIEAATTNLEKTNEKQCATPST